MFYFFQALQAVSRKCSGMQFLKLKGILLLLIMCFFFFAKVLLIKRPIIHKIIRSLFYLVYSFCLSPSLVAFPFCFTLSYWSSILCKPSIILFPRSKQFKTHMLRLIGKSFRNEMFINICLPALTSRSKHRLHFSCCLSYLLLGVTFVGSRL